MGLGTLFKDGKKGEALCILCNRLVWYTLSFSTNILARHIQAYHAAVNIEHLTAKASKTIAKEKENKGSTYNAIPLASGVLGSTTSSITSWLVDCPSFGKCLVRFMVTTYQSFRICEEPTFRDLCRSLNKKARILSREKLTSLVKDEYYVVLQKLKGILVDREFAITTDAWTRVVNSNAAYILIILR